MLIALVPAMVMGVVFFGPRALVATIISVVACEFFEWAYRKIMKKSCANKDLSAAVTGVLLAFVCAPTLPYWMLIIGDFFAIVVVKQLFGGLGKNFLNPALAGRAFLMLSYPVAMTTWSVPGEWVGLVSAADAVTGATPLSADYQCTPASCRGHPGRYAGGQHRRLVNRRGVRRAAPRWAASYLHPGRGVIRPNDPVAFIADRGRAQPLSSPGRQRQPGVDAL